MTNQLISRRSFLGASAALAVASPLIIPHSALAQSNREITEEDIIDEINMLKGLYSLDIEGHPVLGPTDGGGFENGKIMPWWYGAPPFDSADEMAVNTDRIFGDGLTYHQFVNVVSKDSEKYATEPYKGKYCLAMTGRGWTSVELYLSERRIARHHWQQYVVKVIPDRPLQLRYWVKVNQAAVNLLPNSLFTPGAAVLFHFRDCVKGNYYSGYVGHVGTADHRFRFLPGNDIPDATTEWVQHTANVTTRTDFLEILLRLALRGKDDNGEQGVVWLDNIQLFDLTELEAKKYEYGLISTPPPRPETPRPVVEPEPEGGRLLVWDDDFGQPVGTVLHMTSGGTGWGYARQDSNRAYTVSDENPLVYRDGALTLKDSGTYATKGDNANRGINYWRPMTGMFGQNTINGTTWVSLVLRHRGISDRILELTEGVQAPHKKFEVITANGKWGVEADWVPRMSNTDVKQNETTFLVLKQEVKDGITHCRWFVNPSLAEEPSDESADISLTFTTNRQFSTMFIRADDFGAFRVGTSFRKVAPLDSDSP